MWKAFNELKKMGWIEGKLPRMVAVQATGCAPIVKAWKEGKRHAELWKDAHTVAAGIRVPVAVGDFLILDAVRESEGFAAEVDDAAIIAAGEEISQKEGFLMCPEGAATYAAYKQGLENGTVSPDETAVLFNCATGLKYELPPADEALDCTKPIDYSKL